MEVWDLADLESGRDGLTPAKARVLVEAASVCLAENGHGDPVDLRLKEYFAGEIVLSWAGITRQMARTHADLVEAVEDGACALAALCCEKRLGLSIAERAARGGGYDYFLGELPGDASDPFERRPVLEVSGILKGDARDVDQRLRAKLHRLASRELEEDTWVMVVEFSEPALWVLKR